MINKISLLLFIFLGLFIKSQEYEKYDFKKRVNNIYQGTLYEAFEEIVNIKPTKNVQLGIIPLSFALWDKEKDVSPNKRYTIDFMRNNIIIDLLGDNNKSCMNEMSFGLNKMLIKYENNHDVGRRVETLLNSFKISSSCDSYIDNSWLSKDFFCKVQVYSSGYINTETDFKIYGIFYYTTLSISSGLWHKSDKKRFDIIIYEKSDDANNLRMRKTTIKGNNEEAIKYLNKNHIDYSANETEQFKEEDFKPLK